MPLQSDLSGPGHIFYVEEKPNDFRLFSASTPDIDWSPLDTLGHLELFEIYFKAMKQKCRKTKKKIKMQKNKKKKIKMQKNQKKYKNAEKQKKEYEPFRWQIVAILINFAPRPKTIEHSTSLFCFQNSLQPWIFTMAGLTLKASSLEKIFFGTHLEHRMRLHIGKRHCDKWIVHHCKPKDGGWQEKI